MSPNDYDEDLAHRLAAALRSQAENTDTPPDAWSRFQARIGAEGRFPERARGGYHPARNRAHWRIPLIAAAAVVAVAVATSAVVTGGFGAGGQRPASPAPGAAGGIAVPIDDTPEFLCAAAGSGTGGQGAAGTGGAASSLSGTGPASYGTTSGSPAPVTVTLAFDGGEPPEASLSATFAFPGGLTAGAGDRRSDGTPLGYLAVSGGIPGADSHYLWGAVGPAVAQVQILSPKPAGPTDIDPGFSRCGAHWTIDSGRGTAFSRPAAGTTVWTDLHGGWHGFAVRLPVGATAATVVALGSSGQDLQQRLFDVATGGVSDLPPAQTTPPIQAPPPTTAGSERPAPPSGTTSSSSGVSPTGATAAPNSATAGASTPGTGSPNGPNGPFVVTYQDKPGEPAAAALLQGAVKVVDGCVAMVDPSSGMAYTLVFPRSQVGAATPPAILNFRGANYTDGTALSVAGGEWGPGYPGAPATCPVEAWVVSPYD